MLKKIFTIALAAVAATPLFAEEKVLWENANAPMMSWSELCTISAADIAGIKAGDVITATVTAIKADEKYPKFGFVFSDGTDKYPSAFEMWEHRDELPYEASYTVTADIVDALAAGFTVKGDAVTVTKLVLVADDSEPLPANETLIWADKNAPMLSWSVACSISAAQVATFAAGDELKVLVTEVKEGCEWPKFGFEPGVKDKNYPAEFQMWDHLGKLPYTAVYTITAEDLEAWKNGTDIKGDGVKLTSVMLVKPGVGAGIENIVAGENGETVVYTIQGIRVNNADVEALPAGLYIINGKKVLVK